MKKQLLVILLVLLNFGVWAQWNNGTATNTLVCGSSPTTSKSGNVATSDGEGGMIIAWIDSRDSASKSIYAQRILADGTLKFSKEVLISNATGSYSSVKANLAIVADSSGGAIITWQDSRNITSTNSYTDIYGQRIDANGNLLWTAGGVRLSLTDNTKSNKGSTLPVLVNKSEFILVFNDNRNGTLDFFAQKVSLTDGVLLWKEDVSLHGSKPYVQTQAVALTDGKGGAFVVWQDPRLATTNADIYGQYIDNSGKLLWDTAGLAICSAINQQLTPQLTSDGTGGIVVVWSDQRAKVADGNIYAQKVNAAGIIQWAKDGVLICDYTNNQAVPNIIKGGNGYIVAWSDARKGSSDRNIFAQSIDESGNLQWTTATGGGVPVCQATGSQPINYTSSQNMKILPDGSNGAFIVWDDSRNTSSNIDIYAQRITSAGAVSKGWLADGNVISDAKNNQQSPSIVLDSAYNVIISWNDGRDSTNNIYASKLSPTGSLVLPIHIVYVSAQANNNSVLVSWKTTNESLSTNYIVEHSVDGANFSAIGSVKATTLNSYTFTDNNPTDGINYYRIHATDQLGVSLFSGVMKTTVTSTTKIAISVFPNPVANSLTLSFNGLAQGQYAIRLYNSIGNVVSQQQVDLLGTTATKKIATNSLVKGFYIMKLTDSNGKTIFSKQIIKQ